MSHRIHRKNRKSILVRAAAVFALLAGSGLGLAADGTWAVNSDGNWGTAGNWVSNIIADGASNTAFITANIIPGRTVTLDTPRTIGNLEFSDGGASSFTWTLAGANTLTLDNGANASTITSITPTSISTLLGGGSNGVVFDGPEWTELSGANTYTGVTTVRNGSLYAVGNTADSTDGPLGNATSAIQVGDASTGAGDTVSFYIAGNGNDMGRDLVVNNFGDVVNIGHAGSSGHGLTWSGDITLNRDVNMAVHAASPGLEVTGTISGIGGIVKNDSTADNSTNTGVLILSGNNDYTGQTVVSEGEIRVNHNNALGNTTSTVLLGDSATGGSHVILRLLNGIDLSRDIQVTSNGTDRAILGGTGAGTMTFSGDINLQRDTYLSHNVNAQVTYTGVISGPGGLIIGDNSGGFTNLNGVNNYTGETYISHGSTVINDVVQTSTDGPLGNSDAAVQLGGPIGNTPSLYVNGTGNFTRDVVVSTSASSFARLGTTDTSDPTFTSSLTINNPLLWLTPNLAGSTMIWSGNISGTGDLRKQGSGMLLLTGDNSGLSGDMQLAGGGLQIGSDTAIGTGTMDFQSFGTTIESVGADRTFTNNVDFGRPATLVGSNDLIFTGSAVMTAGAGNVQLINNGTGVFGFLGDITGSDGIQKGGNGDVVLGGNSSYTGVTNVDDGRLIVQSNNALGAVGDGTVVDNDASLAFQGGVNYSSNEAVSATGAGHAGLGAIQSISGNNTFAGGITVSGSTTISTAADTLTLTGSLTGTGDLTLAGAGTTNIAADLSGVTNVIVTGPGTVIFSNATGNTYGGITTVSGGTLLVTNASGSATGAGGVGVTGTLGGNGIIDGTVTVNPGGTVSPGQSAGNLTVNDDVTFSLGSTHALEILALPVGFDFDVLTVNGAVALNNADLAVTLTTPVAKWQKLFIVVNDDTDAIGGEFLGKPQGGLITLSPGNFARISYFGDSGSNSIAGGNDIVLYDFSTTIPEPTTLSLLVLGGLMLTRPHKNRKA